MLLAVTMLLPKSIMAANPDLSEYTLIKTLDFTTNTYPSDPTLTLSDTNSGITAYETGNAKQQIVYDVISPEELTGYIYFQGTGSRGWAIRSSKGGLWSYNAPRSAAIPNLKEGYVVVFNCTQAASNVMTLTNGSGEPDGNFTYKASEDGNSYYCTMTEDGYVGFCGNKSAGYIASISIYAPGTVLIQPTAKVVGVNGKARTVEFSGANIAYNTDGSDTYTSTGENTFQTTVSETTTFYVVSTNGSEKSDRLEFTVEAGTEISLAVPTVSLSSISAGYAKTYNVVCNNLNVLLNPTAKLTYDFAAVEGTSESGVEFDGTINATAAGVYTVTASAEGYLSTTVTIDNTKEYELTKSIDLQALTGADLSANWVLQQENCKLPGSSSQWQRYFPDVTTNEYYYNFSAETAASTDIIDGLDIEMNKETGKTPKFYTGWGLIYPVYVLNADGSNGSGANTTCKIAIANGTAEQYGSYTYMTGYAGTLATKILSGDQSLSINRFDNCLTKVEIYTPKDVVAEDVVATINFNESTYATSNNGTEGDIVENKVITEGDLTLTITPKTAGNTENRFWSTTAGPQLRCYSGKILFNVPEGKAIKAIEISQGKWNNSNAFNGVASTESTWSGNSTNVVLNIAGNTQIDKISVTINDADENTTKYVDLPKAANIAEMKALEDGTEAILTLTDAKVTYYYNGRQRYSIIEDATGAIKIDTSISLMIEEGKEGSILNGTLTATLNKVETSGLCTLNLSDNTDMTFTVTEGTATPTVTTLTDLIAEENKDANLLRYVKLDEGLDVETVEDDWGNKDLYLVSGETKLHINDCYYKFPDMMPEFTKFNSISGFLSASYNGTLEFNPYGEDYDAESKPATVVENIAALKQLKNGTYAKLTLTNAQIKVKEVPMMWGDDYVVIEDETAGIQIDLASDYLYENFNELGKTFNGTLYCQYVDAYGTVAIGESDSTSYSEITYGEAEVVAKEISISDATTANYDTRLVTIKGVKTQAPPEGEYSMYPLMTKDGKTLPIDDRFGKLQDMETGEYKFYDKCQVTGLIMQSTVGYDEETYEEIMGDVFLLTDIVETPQVYKQIENTYTLLPTADVVTAAVAEGWIEHGGTYTTNKKGHYNPETGEALEKATTMPGVGVKKGNAAKTFVTYVTGASKLTAYAVSTSNAVRYLVVTATSEDGSDVKEGRDGNDSSASCVVSLDLDKDKKYTIEYTGVDESDAGADVCLYGVRFEVPVTDGIQSIDSTVNVLGGDVYTVNGVKVRKAGESLNGLAKGLYIIGGKKVVVK